MINFSLAKEIYGLTPWMMDVHSIPVMTAILKDIKNGVRFETSEIKLNSTYIYDFKNETKIIEREYQLESNADFEGIALINLNGPITKSGGMSSYGMEQISAMMYRMSSDTRIKAFLLMVDSGGGSSSAVQIMVDTINDVKAITPVYSLITKGGMAASAAYGIISATNQIYSESEMNIVGSIGTMIQFEGKEANSTSPDGTKNIRLYATKSTKKNGGFEKALNEGDFSVITNSLLDPINENFIEMISTNRPKIKSTTFDDGDTFFSKDVIGTFIDGIAGFSEVINIIVGSEEFNATKKNEFFNTNNNNNQKMTKAEFKTANPEAYDQIIAEGVAQEKDRSGAWLAHVKTDPESVVKGIEGGEQLSQSQREAFFVKQNSIAKVEKITNESADDLTVDESLTDVSKINQEKKANEVKAAFDFELK